MEINAVVAPATANASAVYENTETVQLTPTPNRKVQFDFTYIIVNYF